MDLGSKLKETEQGKMGTKVTAGRAREVLNRLMLSAGVESSSVGELEQLAGIDTSSHAERWAVWEKFSERFEGDLQAMVAAVMEECSVRTLHRLADGAMSIVAAVVEERAESAREVAAMAAKWREDNGGNPV